MFSCLLFCVTICSNEGVIMKKKQVIILSCAVFLLVAVITVTSFLPEKPKQKLQLWGENSIVTEMNERYHIPYDQNKKSKIQKLIYQDNGTKKELSELSESSILNFYFDLGLLNKEEIKHDFLKELNFSTSILLFMPANSNGEFKTMVESLAKENDLSYQIYSYADLKEFTKMLVLEQFGFENDTKMQLLLQKDGKKLEKIDQIISKEDLRTTLEKNQLIEKIATTPTDQTTTDTTIPPKDNTKPGTSPKPEPKPEIPTPSKPDTPPTPPITPQPDSTVYFQKVNATKFESLTQSNQKQILIVGQTNCGFCKAALPVLDKIAKEKKIFIYYIDVLEDGNRYAPWNSLPTMAKSIGTPYTMIVQNKTILASTEKLYLEKDYLAFFTNNGVL